MPALPWIGRLLYNGRVFGSAFVVHPSGYIVTCYHVLEDAVGAASISTQKFTFDPLIETAPPITISTQALDQINDLAILKIEGTVPPQLKAATLFTDPTLVVRTGFELQGYGVVDDPGKTYHFMSATGIVVGPAKRDNVQLIQLESKQILKGMSGSPVCLTSERHEVIGVLSERFLVRPGETFMRDTAWAIPVEKLISLLPQLGLPIPTTVKQPASNPKQKSEEMEFNRELTFEELTQLVSLTQVCPIMQNPGGRHSVQSLLPDDIKYAIEELVNANANQQVTSVIKACLNYSQGDGLQILLNTIRFFDGATRQFKKLEEYVGLLNNK